MIFIEKNFGISQISFGLMAEVGKIDAEFLDFFTICLSILTGIGSLLCKNSYSGLILLKRILRQTITAVWFFITIFVIHLGCI